MAELVQSVLKAYQVLRAFGPGSGPLTVREISALTGIPRSTCHALCITLEHISMLEAVSGGGYQLGSAQAWLGAPAFERTGLVEAACVQVEQLHRMGYSSVSVSQYVARGWMVFLHRVGDSSTHRLGGLGTRIPAHACVEGLVVLASMSPGECWDILSPTDSSRLAAEGAPVDYLETLRTLLDRARQQGYLVAGHATSSTQTIACPVIGARGTAVGALSVCVSSRALTTNRHATIVEQLRESARAVSSRAARAG